jgi:hypothetical protein
MAGMTVLKRDPWMMMYLDVQNSRKSCPNEDLACELMELITLGIGNYAEGDIRQAARAFTGYRINPADHISFRCMQAEHNERRKRFMSVASNFDGHDLIDEIPTLLTTLTFRMLQKPGVDKPCCAFFNVLAGRPRQLDEQTIRELLHLMMSTPLFQFC